MFVGEIDDGDESDLFIVPKGAGKTATLVGTGHQPLTISGWIRFFQSPDETTCIGNFFVSHGSNPFEVPDAAQYFSVFNQSGRKMKISVIFDFAL